jgi:WD40 repeat protein
LKPEGKGKGAGPKGKAVISHSQTIIYDVSQPLEEIQAPRDAVKSTAIALVKQDSVFLPGTTIGATHWVAYAMTKGRVRVISRSSGDRTLLQLPPAFPNSTSVTDMAVYGNRLAGVTSDGGFVVWELPDVITDDVPGQLLLCVGPGALGEGLHSVKWHPKQSETVAVASDSKIFLLELGIVARTFRGTPLPQAELHRIAQVFSVPSRLVAFDFDVLHYALATISEDSTLTLWNIPDKLPFWSHKVRGDDIPSSITFVDDGIVIGRKNGTVFQLLSVVSKNVLATIKFVNGHQEDPEMFGHVNYDSRVQTLWVANSRRDSMIAFKIGYDNSTSPSGEVKGAYFEQVVEFAGPKPTIHFVILSAEADPTGQEAHAACVAAKVPPGELALVAFSVHSTGVDQILIRREWFDSSLDATAAKYPTHSLPNPPHATSIGLGKQQGQLGVPSPYRVRTPPAEELDGDMSRDEGRAPEAKGKKNGGAAKPKTVVFKDSDDNKEKKEKNPDIALINESALGQALSREIKKSEESLHTRIGRLIGKEMDKQHHRLEDARAHEQAEDFTRQEKILKLISTELTRNTTRVVEMAVKAEVQTSVLPALENITRTEVRSALNEHVGGGLANYVQQNLPNEIEKLLMRPDISGHFANILSSNLNPLIERFVKDSISKNFMPAYSQQSSAMHQEMLHELRSEILKVKKESIAWQNEALRGQESLIRDLEHSVRVLSDQVKFLTMNVPTVGGSHLQHQHTNSPGPSGQHHQANQLSQSHLRQPPTTQASSNYPQSHPPFQQQSPASGMHSQWFSSGIAAPQASHPLAPPPPPPPPPAQTSQRTPPAPAQSEEWDDTYLAVLGTQDPRQLRELLSRSNPEVIMPLSGPGPLSQAVILTLLHRLAAIVGETPPHEEIFKQSLWWLQRTASALNTNDPLISPYIARVVPNVQQMLNTTKSRCAILPGGPPLVDAVRSISDIQDTLSRKPA